MPPGGNANSSSFVAYLEQLKLNFPGEITVIWDRLHAHRSKKVQAWVARHPRFMIEYFPPYAPELNPVEFAWGYLKGHAMKNFAARDLGELHLRTKAEACRMRRSSRVVQSWIRKSGLPMDSLYW
jgi:transposase